jgi:hypothetical protein
MNEKSLSKQVDDFVKRKLAAKLEVWAGQERVASPALAKSVKKEHEERKAAKTRRKKDNALRKPVSLLGLICRFEGQLISSYHNSSRMRKKSLSHSKSSSSRLLKRCRSEIPQRTR